MTRAQVWSFLRDFLRPRDEWVLVFLGGFLFFIGTNTQSGWLFVVDAFLAALMIVGFAVPRIQLRSITAVRDTAPATVEGDDLTVLIRVINQSAYRRSLITVTDRGPQELLEKPKKFVVASLGPRASVTLSYTLHCPYRGVFSFPDLELQSAAPVGLFPYHRSLPRADEILVHPHGPTLRQVAQVQVSPRAATDQRTINRAGQSFDLQGIREYQWGDDTRRVHWPSTARTGQLMVRQYRESGSQALTVLVENHALSQVGQAGHTPLDEACRLAASLVGYAQRANTRVTLMSGSQQMLRRPREVEALDWLARLTPQSGDTWCDVLMRHRDALPGEGHLFIVATLPLWKEEVLHMLGESGLRTQMIMLEWHTFHSAEDADLLPPPFRPRDYEELYQRLRASSIRVRRVGCGTDLREAMAL